MEDFGRMISHKIFSLGFHIFQTGREEILPSGWNENNHLEKVGEINQK